jgi:hypothetical protein
MNHRHTICHSRVGLVQISQKAHQDTLCQTSVFASGGICWSCSSFQRIRGTKHRHTICHSQVELYGFYKKWARTRYTELVFLHPVGSVGHVVHSDASGSRIIDALFFMLGWHRYGFHKPRWDTLRRVMLCRTCVFASSGICESRSVF